MKCKIDGCYAKSYHRNLCRAHLRMWLDQITSTEPGVTERRPPMCAPAPKTPRYAGPCRCPEPLPQLIVWWNCYQCARCGMPLPTERINDEQRDTDAGHATV